MSELKLSAGDFVVYPAHGVGRLIGFETHEIGDHKVELYVINFEKERMTLRLPVKKAQAAGLRAISTHDTMAQALQTLTVRTRQRRLMWSRRAQEYENKINSGNPCSIAEVVRELYRNHADVDQSYSERQIYHAALERLARELAAVEKIDESSAVTKMENILKAA